MIIDGIKFGKDYQNNAEIIWVPVDWLMRNIEQFGDFDDEGQDIAYVIESKSGDSGFDALVMSIMTHGFNEGGAIAFDNGYLSEGHHRFCASVLLCLDTVPIKRYGVNRHAVDVAEGIPYVDAHHNWCADKSSYLV